MFDSPIFEVVIGLVFIIVVLSLICSTINELIAQTLKLRSSGAVPEKPKANS